jgi:ABC-type Zn uptake system ZnuABC Zn-binding protein ZnuA
VKVIPIIKPGIDPHEFQPSPSDVKEIETADLVLITGKGIESYLVKLEEAVGNKAKFVDAGSPISSLKLPADSPPAASGHY